MAGSLVAIDSAVVHNTGTEIIAGAKAFSGQIELTGQSPATASSALTVGKRPVARAQGIGMRFGGAPPVMAGSGGGRTAYGKSSTSVLSAAAAGSYSAHHYAYLQYNSAWTGGGLNFSAPWLASSAIMLRGLSSNMAVRMIIGQTSAAAPSLSNQTFATSKSVAVEIYNDAGTAKARVLSHDGVTASVSGAVISLGAVTSLFSKTIRFAMQNVGDGTYHLWMDSVTSTNAPTKLDLTASPSISITNGPTGNGAAYCTLLTIAHLTATAGAATSNDDLFILNCELEYTP